MTSQHYDLFSQVLPSNTHYSRDKFKIKSPLSGYLKLHTQKGGVVFPTNHSFKFILKQIQKLKLYSN